MAQPQQEFDPTKDSWAPGEPIPKGMPSADQPSGPVTGGAAPVAKQLADIQRQKVAADEQAYGDLSRSTGQAAGLARGAYEQEAASLHDPALQPWNEKEEQAKYAGDPIKEFGSIGSVFGIIASSFTNAPFTNSLNAAAAAINAQKKGNRQAYLDARQAWQDNYKLALHRHDIMHQQYEDAATLLRTNLAVGEAKIKMLALKFGDKQALALADAGMIPQLMEMMAARDKLATYGLANEQALQRHHLEEDAVHEVNMELRKAGKPPMSAVQEIEFRKMIKGGLVDPSMLGLPGGSPGLDGSTGQSGGKPKSDLPFSESFGVKGTFNWLQRKSEDFLSGTFSKDTAERTRAQQEWQTLRFRALNALTADVGSEQRLKIIQERVQSLFPPIESLWTGPAEAVSKIRVLRSDLATQLKENAQILMSPGFDQKTKEKALLRMIAQRNVIQQMDKVLSDIATREGSERSSDEGPWNKYK